MSRKTHIPVSWLRHSLVVVVYALFFVVQLFFNLDTPRQPFAEAPSVIKATTSQSWSQSHSKDAGSQAKKLRLNKRFHPSCAPVVQQVAVERTCRYIRKPGPGSYVSPCFPSQVYTSHALRGPPFVA